MGTETLNAKKRKQPEAAAFFFVTEIGHCFFRDRDRSLFVS